MTVIVMYKPKKVCKNSVQVTPTDESLKQHEDMKLPDLYITNDVLAKLGFKRTEFFTIKVTFETEKL